MTLNTSGSGRDTSSGLLELRNVSFRYPGRETVLLDVNLTVETGDLIIIKGESGAGKSTLLKLLNRFCDYESGMILLHGRELKEYRIEELRKTILYLPQIPVMMEGTIAENLSFPFSFRAHKGKKFNPRDARRWLDHFQLDLPLDTEALALSIGQRQRVALIRAMILEPRVLLLDEPGASLDEKNRKLIHEKVEHLIRTTGVTVVLATHGDAGPSLPSCRGYLIRESRLTAIRHGDT